MMTVAVISTVGHIDSNRLLQAECNEGFHGNIQLFAAGGKARRGSCARARECPDGRTFTPSGDRAQDGAQNRAATGKFTDMFLVRARSSGFGYRFRRRDTVTAPVYSNRIQVYGDFVPADPPGNQFNLRTARHEHVAVLVKNITVDDPWVDSSIALGSADMDRLLGPHHDIGTTGDPVSGYDRDRERQQEKQLFGHKNSSELAEQFRSHSGKEDTGGAAERRGVRIYSQINRLGVSAAQDCDDGDTLHRLEYDAVAL